MSIFLSDLSITAPIFTKHRHGGGSSHIPLATTATFNIQSYQLPSTNIIDPNLQTMTEDLNMNDSLSGTPSSTFPQKLFAMSIHEFDEGEVIHWLPHGLAFKVVDSDKFSEEVIPKYFKRKYYITCKTIKF